MRNDDLVFSVKDEKGKERECIILSLIPKEEGTGYVVFVDGDTDEKGVPILKYGLLEEDADGDYQLKKGITEEELEFIKEKSGEDLIELAQEIVIRYSKNRRI